MPVDGKPSERTGEAFSCRTWVKDTLVSLDENGAILLPTDMGKEPPLAPVLELIATR